jgi:hypothetical protein
VIIDQYGFESLFFQVLARDLLKVLIFFLSLKIYCKGKPAREITREGALNLEI